MTTRFRAGFGVRVFLCSGALRAEAGDGVPVLAVPGAG